MLWMMLMGLAGSAAAWGLYEAFTDDDDDHVRMTTTIMKPRTTRRSRMTMVAT